MCAKLNNEQLKTVEKLNQLKDLNKATQCKSKQFDDMLKGIADDKKVRNCTKEIQNLELK